MTGTSELGPPSPTTFRQRRGRHDRDRYSRRRDRRPGQGQRLRHPQRERRLPQPALLRPAEHLPAHGRLRGGPDPTAPRPAAALPRHGHRLRRADGLQGLRPRVPGRHGGVQRPRRLRGLPAVRGRPAQGGLQRQPQGDEGADRLLHQADEGVHQVDGRLHQEDQGRRVLRASWPRARATSTTSLPRPRQTGR